MYKLNVESVDDIKNELMEDVSEAANDLGESISKVLDDFVEDMEKAQHVFALQKAVEWILYGMSDSDREYIDHLEDFSLEFQLEYIREKFHDVEPLFKCCCDVRCHRSEFALGLRAPSGDRAPKGFYICPECGSDHGHDRIPHKYYDEDDPNYVTPEFNVQGMYEIRQQYKPDEDV